MLIYDFELEHKEAGQYNYDVVKIMDKSKCVYQFENGENSLSLDVVQRNPWVIEMTESPRISVNREANRACAGQVIAFNMEGTGPYEIYTRFYPLQLNRELAMKGIYTEWGNGANINEEYVDGVFKIEAEDEEFSMLADNLT